MSSSAIGVTTTRPTFPRRLLGSLARRGTARFDSIMGIALSLAALLGCGDEARTGVTEPSEAADGGPSRPADAEAPTPRDAGPRTDGGAERDAARSGDDDAAIAPGDGGVRPPPACDPVAQTGCAAGLRCDRTPVGLACTAAGTLAPFARCEREGPAICVGGTSCAETNFDDARCTPFCEPETLSGCPGSGQTCRLRRPDDAFALCSFAHECSPLRQDCARAGEHCAWTLLGAFCVTPAARIPDGGECQNAVACAEGSTCVDDGAGRTRCFKQCAPKSEPEVCAAGERCEAYAEVWPDALGICRPQP